MHHANTNRSVYDTAHELQEMAARTSQRPHHLAREKLKECREAGNREGVLFWRDVWINTILIEQGQRDVQILTDN